MEINLEIIIEYAQKLNQSITVSIDTENYINPVLTFHKGKPRSNGSVAIHLDFTDIKEILLLNNILGENGKLKQELDRINKIPSNERGQHIKQSEIDIEKYTYETLAKYIVQMLNASQGRIIFPEIKSLEKHTATYFKN